MLIAVCNLIESLLNLLSICIKIKKLIFLFFAYLMSCHGNSLLFNYKEAAMKNLTCLIVVLSMLVCGALSAQGGSFDPLQVNLGNLYNLSDAKTRSISPENHTGGKGMGGMAKVGEGSASRAARDLGQGWKVNPYVRVAPGDNVRARRNRRPRRYTAYLDHSGGNLPLFDPQNVLGW